MDSRTSRSSEKPLPEVLDALVVHYHEIGLKGRNRARFEEQLAGNLRRALRGTGYRRIRCRAGRITVDFASPALVAQAGEKAGRVFGVANVGAGVRVDPEQASIVAAAQELMPPGSYSSFSVRARRARSTSRLRSSEIERTVGALLQEKSGAAVNLNEPDATLYVELFEDTGIAYRERRRGPGGLPVGSAGKMVALLSGGIDSPVAAWHMMRRGAEVELLHFHGAPYTDSSSVAQAVDLTRLLSRYHLATTLHLVPLGEAQAEIVTHCPARLRVLLYRRLMLRIAAALAVERSAKAIVTGDALGQVASQTLDNLITIDRAVSGTPVLRPLIGFDKIDIVREAEDIGTLSTSNRHHQDCCVLFETRAPLTHAAPRLAEAAERPLDMNALVGKALADRESRVIEPPNL